MYWHDGEFENFVFGSTDCHSSEETSSYDTILNVYWCLERKIRPKMAMFIAYKINVVQGSGVLYACVRRMSAIWFTEIRVGSFPQYKILPCG